MKELNNFREFLNEEKALSVQIKPIPVTLTREDFDTDEEWDEFVEMLRVAQDLENIRKTHDGVEGTRLLNARMQDRDALIKAAMVLKNLVELSNRK